MAVRCLIASRICVNTMLQHVVMYGEEGFSYLFQKSIQESNSNRLCEFYAVTKSNMYQNL